MYHVNEKLQYINQCTVNSSLENKGFGQNLNNYLTQGWYQTSVGKSYLSLFPNNIHVTPKCGIQEPIAGCFDAGMGTINFHNCYHKDQRDVNELTHCSFSSPEKWKHDTGSDSPHCAFCMGSVVVDVSFVPQRITFLPSQTYHCTSQPRNVPVIPSYLISKTNSSVMLQKEKELKNCLQDCMLAWGSWNWFCKNSCRNREWISAVEGITDSAERSTIRRNLIDCNWSRENNQRTQQSRQRTRRHKRTAKACCKRHGVEENSKSKHARLNTKTCTK